MQTITMRKSQSGVSMIETLIVLPIMLFMGMGVIHLGLVYQAKSNLEYAALMAARVGSLTGINMNEMLNEAALRMAPSKIGPNFPSPGEFQIEILNPTEQMFLTCGELSLNITDCVDPNRCEIPNFGLQFRPVDTSCDGTSIQDANILRINVTYRFNSRVPFMNARLFTVDGDDRELQGINISAVATVRMQTPARYTVGLY